MTLHDLVKNQLDKDYYEKALSDLDSKLSLLGKRLLRPGLPLREEEKKDGDVRMGEALQLNYYEEYRLSEEDKHLIELYGPKIHVVRWYFENDQVVKDLVANKKKNFGGLQQLPFADEYDDEYDNESEVGYGYKQPKLPSKKQVEEDEPIFIEGHGYTPLNEENSKAIEDTFQQYLATKKPQETYIQAGDDIYQVRFDKLYGWEIKNTSTQIGRDLRRNETIKGPFIETRTFNWLLVDDQGQ